MQTVRQPRVTMIDDHELLAHTLKIALRSSEIAMYVAALTSVEQILAQMREDPPDVALVDLQLGEPLGDGEAFIAPLAELGVGVVVVSAVTDRMRIAGALEAGAIGFISKAERFDVLVDKVRRAGNGEPIMADAVRMELLADLRRHRAQEWARKSLFRRLTQREEQVLEALCDGKTVEHIALDWTVSVATVRSQVRAVLTKLNVNSQLTAVALARKSGWSPSR